MSDDSPTLILSQDYELFFQQSGSPEKCLFEPCEALLDFADKRRLKITFYVDVGMILCMERHAAESATLKRVGQQISEHVALLARRGHDIALHIHPHWEDTRWRDGAWDFSDSRYQLDFFDPAEISTVVQDYAARLADISDRQPTSYRAGGFCVEPFDLLGDSLTAAGITIDSSVVPGANLIDPEKGFDFSGAPDKAWWRFTESPARPDAKGTFLEIPVTPQRLPLYFYWGRLVDRLLKQATSNRFGDGTSKAIGRQEILRRLAGKSLVAELSIDDAKAEHLMAARNVRAERRVWHLMGHPKLVSHESLDVLGRFIDAKNIRRFATVDAYADSVSSSPEASRGPNRATL